MAFLVTMGSQETHLTSHASQHPFLLLHQPVAPLISNTGGSLRREGQLMLICAGGGLLVAAGRRRML